MMTTATIAFLLAFLLPMAYSNHPYPIPRYHVRRVDWLCWCQVPLQHFISWMFRSFEDQIEAGAEG